MPDPRRRLAGLILLLALGGSPANAATTLPGSEQVIDPAWRTALEEQGKPATPWANRLALSGSAYLRQHGDNPIDWFAWSDRPFERAVRLDRLVLVSVGYASCHWCHVMERESFADESVARVLNEHFVSVKVDRELQPDVDAYYLDLVRRVRGESGWPITVILTPEREPVFAANYLTREQLITVAERFAGRWSAQPDSLQAMAAMMREQLPDHDSQSPGAAWDPALPGRALEDTLALRDPEFGGFGRGAKFPGEIRLQFLLDAYKRDPGEALRRVLVEELDRFMQSGLVDVVFGGVFRYTTDRAMTTPHFEKMLYNQALTVRVFAEAGDWLSEPRYTAFAQEVLAFAQHALGLETGLAAALDAEFDAEEGGYYLWSDDALPATPLSGLDTVRLGPDKVFLFGAAETNEGRQLLASLRAVRDRPPRRIDNRITAWNALWIEALLAIGAAGEAADLAERLWASAWDGSRLERAPGQPGFFDDYARLSRAYWWLYREQGDRAWKTRARQLDEALLNRFLADGALRYRDAEGADPMLQFDLFLDRELPSAVASALEVLAYHPSEARFIDAERRLRRQAAAAAARSPSDHLAILRALGKPVPAPSAIVAQGRGRAALRSAEEGGYRIDLSLDPGWHVNASEVLDDQLVPTRVEAREETSILYPEGKLLEAAFSDQPLPVYEGDVSILVEDWTPQSPHDGLTLYLQACSERICLLPEQLELRVR